MQSRLEILNPSLAAEIKSTDLEEAHERVMSILIERLAALPDKTLRLLPEKFHIQSSSVSKNQIDALDGRYFDAEEAGNAEDAEASFMAARVLAAVMYWQTATNQFDLCEAVYEVMNNIDTSGLKPDAINI